MRYNALTRIEISCKNPCNYMNGLFDKTRGMGNIECSKILWLEDTPKSASSNRYFVCESPNIYHILQVLTPPSGLGIYCTACLSCSLLLQTTFLLPLVYLQYLRLTSCYYITESHWKKLMEILRQAHERSGFCACSKL